MQNNFLPGIRRRLVCMLYEGLVVFSILLIGFLLPQIVLSGFGHSLTPRTLWLHVIILLMVLLCLVLAQWRPDSAHENMETSRR